MVHAQTLLVALAATDVILAAALWVGAGGRPRDGLGAWILALAVRAGAFGIFASEGLAVDPGTLVLAVGLMGLSLTLQAASLLAFGKRALPHWVHSGMLAGLCVPFALLAGDAAARWLFGGFAFGIILLVLTGIAAQLRAPMSRGTRALLIGSFALGALVLFARALGAFATPLAEDGAPASWQALNAFALFAAVLASSCAYLLLHKERADAAAVRLATIDPLTGAYNRGTFHATAERELARARRFNQPLSIIVVDIDHFRAVNDQYGHRMGDEVIRLLADRIREQLRQEDLLVRFGGEEFCVMLPNVPGNGAVVVAGRIRRAVEAEPLVIDGREVAVTVSAGVAARLDEGPESMEGLLARADEALGLAKQRGRNRVVALSLGRSIAA